MVLWYTFPVLVRCTEKNLAAVHPKRRLAAPPAVRLGGDAREKLPPRPLRSRAPSSQFRWADECDVKSALTSLKKWLLASCHTKLTTFNRKVGENLKKWLISCHSWHLFEEKSVKIIWKSDYSLHAIQSWQLLIEKSVKIWQKATYFMPSLESRQLIDEKSVKIRMQSATNFVWRFLLWTVLPNIVWGVRNFEEPVNKQKGNRRVFWTRSNKKQSKACFMMLTCWTYVSAMQGDQIELIFTDWAIVYFRQIIEITKVMYFFQCPQLRSYVHIFRHFFHAFHN
jgi:hypothetical protein